MNSLFTKEPLEILFGWHPSGIPSVCACSKNFTVEHDMDCPTGGFPTIQDNKLHEFTAILSEVCDVSVEPQL